MEKRILFAGNVDQGILYAGQVLIEAAVEAGWRAACVDSGQQGDIIYCSILLSNEPLSQIGAAMPDVGMLASLSAANAFERMVKSGGLLVLNASDIRRPVLRRDVDVVMAPAFPMAAEDPVLATLTLLGVLVNLTGWMPIDVVIQVVRKSCVGDAACAAFRYGVTFVEEMVMNASSEAA